MPTNNESESYFVSFISIFTPPYTFMTILEMIISLVCLVFLPNVLAFTFVVTVYSACRPAILRSKIQNQPPQANAEFVFFSYEWPWKREVLLLVLMCIPLLGSFLYEADAPYEVTSNRFLSNNGSFVYITFTGQYQRCILERTYTLQNSAGCGETSPDDQVMRVLLADDIEECVIVPKVRCNWIEFSGRALCWEKNMDGINKCVGDGAKKRLARDTGAKPSRTTHGRAPHTSVFPTSSIRSLAWSMDASRSILQWIGGPHIKEIVDRTSQFIFPLPLAIDVFLLGYGLFKCAGVIGNKDWQQKKTWYQGHSIASKE